MQAAQRSSSGAASALPFALAVSESSWDWVGPATAGCDRLVGGAEKALQDGGEVDGGAAARLGGWGTRRRA
jgi:hypothetical protein